MSEAVDFIETGMSQGYYVVVIFMDIMGAFDNIKNENIKAFLRSKHLPDWFSNWYGNVLTKRIITIDMNNYSETRETSVGSAQGGSLALPTGI